MDALTNQVERIKASTRAKVEHPFRVIKRQFVHVKVRYHGLAKNSARTVCAGQSVDGAQVFDGEPGMSALRAWEMDANRAQNTSQRPSGHQYGHVRTSTTMVKAHLCRPSLDEAIEQVGILADQRTRTVMVDNGSKGTGVAVVQILRSGKRGGVTCTMK